jgi:predicted metal-binding protein
MSYSFNRECEKCLHEPKCIDPKIMRGAIDAIHMCGYERSHLGSGVINLQCQNFVERESKTTNVKHPNP